MRTPNFDSVFGSCDTCYFPIQNEKSFDQNN